MNDNLRDALITNYDSSNISIKQSNIEGECVIEGITLLRIKKLKLVLAVFLSIITCGIFLLLLRWFFKLRKTFLYKEVYKIQDCTHVLVLNSDKTLVFQNLENNDLKANQKDDQSYDKAFCFQNRMLRYVYYEQKGLRYFQALEFPVIEMDFNQLRQQNFLDKNQVHDNQQHYGKCERVIDIPSLPSYLFKEMTSPFYFLQYISMLLWIFETYIQFSIMIFSVSFAVTCLNYIMMRISLKKLQQMAHINDNLTVLRKSTSQLPCDYIPGDEGEAQQILTKELAVGDIIVLQDKQVLPCDCILICGEALLNEVTLTGESLPIPKYPLPSQNQKFSYSKNFNKYILYEGTEIFQSKKDQNQQVLAKVIRVGFQSFKGQILRSVLYPKPLKFDYYLNAMYYLVGLLVIVLIVYFSRIYQMYVLNFPQQFYFYRFFDTVTWIIPPFLPIFAAISQTLAMMRLRLYHIYGIDPQKTFISGKVTHMCFDKTGTLTQNGMNVYGYFNENLDQMITKQMVQEENRCNDIQHKLFSTCHGAYLINGEIVGDMLDIEMVKFSGYQIQNVQDNINIKFKSSHPNTQNELQVMKMFEFSSEMQSMSCVAYDIKAQKSYLFLKGAPEKVRDMCQSSTIPSNFKYMQNKLSLKGFRLIAMAYKELSSSKEAIDLTREELEQNLRFLGFLILENQLKEDTPEAIQSLKEAQIECKIISGDNPLTTLQTGIECQIVDGNRKVYYIDIENSQINLSLIENEEIKPYQIQNQSEIQTITQLISQEEQFVITGKVLDHFYDNLRNASSISLQQLSDINYSIVSENKSLTSSLRSKSQYPNDLFQQLICKTQIFSRMRPEQKRIIIETLQNSGIKVGMIGDGANDCAAIKQGDIGISFACADAAFSAPFSSKSQSIKCVERILLEGRCTMAINIEVFRNIVTQNVMKYISVMILLQEAQNFGSLEFTYLGFLIGIPIVAFIAYSKPPTKLQPYVPDDKFYGLYNTLSMYSQFIIFGVAFFLGYWVITSQSWHVVTTELDESNGLKAYNMSGELNSVIFLMINPLYNLSCIVYHISYPFKQSIFKNIFLFPWLVISTPYLLLTIIMPEYNISALDISSSLSEHRIIMLYVLIIVISSFFISFFLEKLILKKIFGPKKIKETI
ncbi:E1-E2 ATPase family protein (macronuclear) [Tetrahymena thermophila SB210]|uniref:Cation-transporting ATPase n=1 Tax=Tetrahymena thermophila (strain SB210) TaxID=312017 RepID=Q22NH4_TETTS|nr:E1-E2 ATPase family protein [Tetrahymena thermophila SB210]EAR86811.2 E1-E2 ATPase family protein [Tetrahymena thermophila SB210]|eukprot:XP_001007056.2 E1-E2 ATPase family protein [Tetrahymena thermophila SB210]